MYVNIYGAIGEAVSGSSVVWYGVHAFEMVQKLMGSGAVSVYTRRDPAGYVCVVEYPEKRRAIIEFTNNVWTYGGVIRDMEKAFGFNADTSMLYTLLLREIYNFFETGVSPIALKDSLEIMNMLDTADHSAQSGKAEQCPR